MNVVYECRDKFNKAFSWDIIERWSCTVESNLTSNPSCGTFYVDALGKLLNLFVNQDLENRLPITSEYFGNKIR